MLPETLTIEQLIETLQSHIDNGLPKNTKVETIRGMHLYGVIAAKQVYSHVEERDAFVLVTN